MMKHHVGCVGEGNEPFALHDHHTGYDFADAALTAIQE